MYQKTAIIIFLLVINFSSIWASDITDNIEINEQLDEVYYECLDGNYKLAVEIGHRLTTKYRDEPLPWVFLSTVYMYMLRSYWDFPVDSQYSQLVAKFYEVSDQALDVCNNYPEQNSHLFFCKGTILGTQALVHLQNKDWIKSYTNGKKGVATLKQAIELDPTNYDPYLGLGMFEYYCARLTGTVKILAWIIGFRGDEEKGINYVKQVLDKGHYAKGPAEVFLTFVYISNPETIIQGLEMAQILRKKYPHNFLYVDYLLRCIRQFTPEQSQLGIKIISEDIKTPDWRENLRINVPYDLDIVDYELARLLIKNNQLEAAQSLLESLVSKRNNWDSLSSQIELLLLSVYKQNGCSEKAELTYDHIVQSKPIDNSRKKAHQILSSPLRKPTGH